MSLELTYLGCEGVMVRSPAGSVIIDGLFSREAEPFAVPPPSVLEDLRRARPPFDGIDAILATHYHADHFDAESVASYLEANRRAHFVSSHQAVGSLTAIVGAAFADRVHGLDAEEGATRTVRVGAIRVDGFGLSHGRVHYADVEHLGLLVTLGGRRVLHLGDGIIAEKSLRSAGAIDTSIDVGVVPFWFLTYPPGKRLAGVGFGARALFAVHIRVAERERVVAEVGGGAIALTEPLARYEIAAAGGVKRLG